MRRSAAFTLWRRHHKVGESGSLGSTRARDPVVSPLCLRMFGYCHFAVRADTRTSPAPTASSPDQRAVRAHPVSLGKRAVPKAQTVYARACPACPPGANGAMTQPPGAGPANATSGPSAGATTKPSRPPAGIWHLEQPEPGVMTWRLPSGRVYETVGDPY
jgi:hypothetical protein